MKLVIICGEGAVGKMTVGQELAALTGLRLFHNHMIIDPVLEVFGKFEGNTIARLRRVIFTDFAKSDNYGLIFTYMWAFDYPADWDYIAGVCDIFRAVGAEICVAELDAPLDIRLRRNSTPNRLANKPSKRDVAQSDSRLIRESESYRCVSLPGEVEAVYPNYIRIENSDMPPDEAAALIRDRFGL